VKKDDLEFIDLEKQESVDYFASSHVEPEEDDSDGSGEKVRRRYHPAVFVILLLSVLYLVAGVIMLVKYNNQKAREQQEALNIQELLEAQLQQEAQEQAALEASRQAQELAESEAASLAAAAEAAGVVNPYKDYFLRNSDMAGWIKIEGTVIDYPVMQTIEDENYYLYLGFDKEDNENGSLILDTDSRITEPLSTNLIIHGHNMKSGKMFGTLTEYENQDYFEEHRYIQLFTKECERNYEIVAVFRSQVYKVKDEVFKYYKFFQADTQEEFDDFYNNIKYLSVYDTGVEAEFGDHFLTLSTCVYHVETGRLVVVAREIETGEAYEPME